jgi:hypothetical protein
MVQATTDKDKDLCILYTGYCYRWPERRTEGANDTRSAWSVGFFIFIHFVLLSSVHQYFFDDNRTRHLIFLRSICLCTASISIQRRCEHRQSSAETAQKAVSSSDSDIEGSPLLTFMERLCRNLSELNDRLQGYQRQKSQLAEMVDDLPLGDLELFFGRRCKSPHLRVQSKTPKGPKFGRRTSISVVTLGCFLIPASGAAASPT